MYALFVELPPFERHRANYLDDEAFSRLQTALLADPKAGEVIQGTGGLRKMRFSDPRRRKGKRGGLRIIYFWWEAGSQFWLFTLYDKDEMGDLSAGPAKGAQGDARYRGQNAEIMMKTSRKKTIHAARRDLFGELAEGMNALAEARQGKRTLRTHRVEFKPPPEVTPAELLRVRRRLRLSRGLFATFLRTNPRTLENWEQGRARPNAQAALLITLVDKFPDMVERLAKV